MTKIHPLIVLLFLGACAANAQQGPSMSGGSKPASTPAGPFAGLGKDRPADAKTEITANKEATFDNAANVAEFTGNVIVRDPQFTLNCDRLKVTLSKDHKGMEEVEAIGKSGVATYFPASGEATLKDWPSIQSGMNNQVGTEKDTVMILNRNGKSKTIGPSKTMITDTGDAGAPK